MSIRNELQKQFREQQQKFIYYMLALTVTAIGYSLHQSSGVKISLSQIPLAIAILSWSVSVYCGLTFLKFVIATLYVNEEHLKAIDGEHPLAGNHREKQQIVLEATKEAMESNGKKALRLSKWQGRLFYVGMIAYITWQVIDRIN